MYRLEVTDSFEDDLDGILSYIREALSAPKAAASFADKVLECYDRLEDNPYIYAKCLDPKLEKDGYRKVAIKN
jgi:plasmid stabilization system protein ParE